jgi:hypothetical protein
MLTTLIVTIILLLALMTGWILVQRAARHVAEQHPEAGPLWLVGGGCGGDGHGEMKAAPLPSAAVSAEGCAACTNTACKPATLDALACPAELHLVPAE